MFHCTKVQVTMYPVRSARWLKWFQSCPGVSNQECQVAEVVSALSSGIQCQVDEVVSVLSSAIQSGVSCGWSGFSPVQRYPVPSGWSGFSPVQQYPVPGGWSGFSPVQRYPVSWVWPQIGSLCTFRLEITTATVKHSLSQLQVPNELLCGTVRLYCKLATHSWFGQHAATSTRYLIEMFQYFDMTSGVCLWVVYKMFLSFHP